MKALVLIGPNLGRLGTRQPEIYGYDTHADVIQLCHDTGQELGIEVTVKQTDFEGEMLGWLHQAADDATPVILNAGAWTHYSIAVADACAMLNAPLLEVHVTNVYRREKFRQHSVISASATAVMAGFGITGYALALRWLASTQDKSAAAS